MGHSMHGPDPVVSARHYREYNLRAPNLELKANTPFSTETFYEQMGRWRRNIELFLYDCPDTRIYYKGLFKYENGEIIYVPPSS
jgi:hypothetical protein